MYAFLLTSLFYVAGSQIVTAAVFAPFRTKQYLAQHGDAIFSPIAAEAAAAAATPPLPQSRSRADMDATPDMRKKRSNTIELQSPQGMRAKDQSSADNSQMFSLDSNSSLNRLNSRSKQDDASDAATTSGPTGPRSSKRGKSALASSPLAPLAHIIACADYSGAIKVFRTDPREFHQ